MTFSAGTKLGTYEIVALFGAGATANRAGRQWQVSTAGGIVPRWRPDGKEVYSASPITLIQNWKPKQ